MSETFHNRMSRIGSKKNFMRESQANEMQENQKLVVANQRTDGGVTTIDLTLEPNQFNKLGSECRLDFEEFIQVMNLIADEEENEWPTLRMKDQINIVRDRIIEETILKYAKEEYDLRVENFSGKDLNYIKRYDEEGKFLGEAVVLTLTFILTMGMRIK